MSSLTDSRKRAFCRDLFAELETPLVFVDVGSGGPLKAPWTLLPSERIEKVDFDPEAISGDGRRLPLCVSDADGVRQFHIARDPRGSSLHPPNPSFIEWYGHPDLTVERTIEVQCVTLDQHFQGRDQNIDFMDINVEGHDFQVLQGASGLFAASFIKVVKIEFELAEVWKGQGWFADIDGWMRARGYDLIDFGFERMRPANAGGIFHAGEPVWGKAHYAPGAAAWQQRKQARRPEVFAEDVRKAIGLYTTLNAPGRAIALLRAHAEVLGDHQARHWHEQVAKVYRFGLPDYFFDLGLRVMRGLKRRLG